MIYIYIVIFFRVGTVAFNHRNGCQKCSTFGEYSKEFQKLDSPLRTDETFRRRSQPNHHKEKSLFEELNINMVSDFPTSDPLHLLDLGIMRKCMYRWVFGSKKYKSKWSRALIDLTSRLLIQCGKEMPLDFHRAIRKLDSLRHWKGVEYRTMLLYYGIVIFEQVRLIM